MAKMVAFLRGINLGKRQVKMDALKSAFADLGFAGAQTLIASGNVLFEAEGAPDSLAQTLEAGLEKAFGFQVGVVLRTVDRLQELVKTDPFKGYEAGDTAKFYAFFLNQPKAGEMQAEEHVEANYDIIGKTEEDVFAVAWKMPNGRYGEGLDKLDKGFPKGVTVTNRNWNTVLRMIDKAAK